MLNLKNILIAAVCVASVFVTGGCNLIQEDGADRHLLKANICGKEGILSVSILGGSSHSRITTDKTEAEIQASEKPNLNQTEVEKAMIAEGEGNLVMDTQIKKALIVRGLGKHVADALKQ